VLALIADDERAHRTMIKRMLEQLGLEVEEFENGLDLLSRLEVAEPDLVVLDFEMPILNGMDTLRAIRSSPKHRDMPIVFVSALSNADDVRQLLALGVADYLLKPIRVDQAIPRLRHAVRGATRWRERMTSGSIDGLLIIDSDPNFLAFARPLLGASYDVIEASSGMQGVAAFQQRSPPPSVVLVAQGLNLLNEDLVVETLRRVAAQFQATPPEVFLLAFSDQFEAEKARRFHGVLTKSFVPDQSMSAFRRTVLRTASPTERLQQLLEGDLQPELQSATQQTIGALASQDVARLPAAEADALVLPLRAALQIEDRSGAIVEISILSDADSIRGLAGKMLGQPSAPNGDEAGVLDEIVSTVAGRVRASLLARNVDLQMGLPQRFTDEPALSPADWPVKSAFRCQSGEVLLVATRVMSATPSP